MQKGGGEISIFGGGGDINMVLKNSTPLSPYGIPPPSASTSCSNNKTQFNNMFEFDIIIFLAHLVWVL